MKNVCKTREKIPKLKYAQTSENKERSLNEPSLVQKTERERERERERGRKRERRVSACEQASQNNSKNRNRIRDYFPNSQIEYYDLVHAKYGTSEMRELIQIHGGRLFNPDRRRVTIQEYLTLVPGYG